MTLSLNNQINQKKLNISSFSHIIILDIFFRNLIIDLIICLLLENIIRINK